MPASFFGAEPPAVVLKMVVFNATVEVLQGAKALLSNPSRAVVAMSVLLLRDYADDLAAQVQEIWSLFPGYVVRVPKFSNSLVSRAGLRGGGGVGMGVSGMVFVGLVLGCIEAKFCK